MNWSETRNKLLKLAAHRASREGPRSLRDLVEEPTDGGAGPEPRARSLCIASGKGGTGKTVIGAALATLFSERRRTLVVDADLGVGNAHILQDVSPEHTLVDVVEGRVGAREARVECSEALDLVAGGCGVPHMADLNSFELHVIATGLDELEREYGFVVVDSAAGISGQTVSFAATCDVAVVVTTPDLTSLTDAYAFLKVLANRGARRPLLLVNRARDEEEAAGVIQRVSRVCVRYLGEAPLSVGWIPDDELVGECVNRRGAVTRLEPEAPASKALAGAAERILEVLEEREPLGIGRRLLREVGYPARLA